MTENTTSADTSVPTASSAVPTSGIEIHTTLEDRIWPPQVDMVAVGMVSIGAIISGAIGGFLVFLLSYLLLGGMSISFGVSPYLLSLIAFFSFTLASLTQYYISSLVFPTKYTRTLTALSQISLVSILLYICFAPIYLYASTFGSGTQVLLYVFAVHLLVYMLATTIVVEVVSTYRYALVGIYSGFIAFCIMVFIFLASYSGLSTSQNSLFILVGSVILIFFLFAWVHTMLLYLYSTWYMATGSDPVGAIYSRIETEEKTAEAKIASTLTKF